MEKEKETQPIELTEEEAHNVAQILVYASDLLIEGEPLGIEVDIAFLSISVVDKILKVYPGTLEPIHDRGIYGRIKHVLADERNKQILADYIKEREELKKYLPPLSLWW